MSEFIHVVAAVLRDSQHRVLIAQRAPGTHMAGRWEFPGGKLQPSETRRDGLVRELKEELGIDVTDCEPLIRVRHQYPEHEVLLDIWQVSRYDGIVRGAEGQAVKWVAIDQLHEADLLEADKPIVNALRLPDRYAITPVDINNDGIASFVDQLDAVTKAGTDLIQLRIPGIEPGELQALVVAAVQAVRGGRVLINGDPSTTIPLALATGASGVHVPSRYIPDLSAMLLSAGIPPAEFLIGASCHDQEELALAAKAGAQFAVLGPVLPTDSHPNAKTLGWESFARLVDSANLPVYALGGVGPASISRIRELGGQGVAGIRSFFS